MDRWVYLKVSDHHKACSIGAACDECCGVNPGMPTLLQELPVEQEAEQGHWGRRAWVEPASSHPFRNTESHKGNRWVGGELGFLRFLSHQDGYVGVSLWPSRNRDRSGPSCFSPWLGGLC